MHWQAVMCAAALKQKCTKHTFVQDLGSVTEIAPHLAQAAPAGGRHSAHTQQPQFRMTGPLSSLAQEGTLHKKSAMFQRESFAGRAFTGQYKYTT